MPVCNQCSKFTTKQTLCIECSGLERLVFGDGEITIREITAKAYNDYRVIYDDGEQLFFNNVSHLIKFIKQNAHRITII